MPTTDEKERFDELCQSAKSLSDELKADVVTLALYFDSQEYHIVVACHDDSPDPVVAQQLARLLHKWLSMTNEREEETDGRQT